MCRHSECDLHTATNIVATPLKNACTVPWTKGGAAPKCCTSDITLAEFKSLKAKMDASSPAATTAEGFLGGTPAWRTDLYTGRPAGNVVTLKAIFGGQAQRWAQSPLTTRFTSFMDAGT